MIGERITDKEATCLLILFLLGSSILVGIGVRAKNDAWLAGILGVVFFIPFALIYARIQSIFHGRDIFEITILLYGKVFGRILIIIFSWYSFHLGALVLRNFCEFVHVESLPETPLIVITLCFITINIAAARSGIEVIARIATFCLPVVIILFLLMEILSISTMDFNNIKPILGNGFSKVADVGFSSFSFPFAESVILLGVFYTLKKRESAVKVYMKGVLAAGIVLITLTLVNIFVLGNMIEDYYFPSYASFSFIKVGDFIQRMEGTIAISYVLTSFIKSSICLFVACKGIAAVFNLNHYKFIVIQTGLIMAYFSLILYDNIEEMVDWFQNIYQFYAIPFQIIFPLFIWVCAEIRNRSEKRDQSGKGKKGV